MGRDLSFKNFLKDLGIRIGAAAVVVGIFFGLRYLSRTDFFGLSNLLGDRLVFFSVALLLVGTVSLCWAVCRRSGS